MLGLTDPGGMTGKMAERVFLAQRIDIEGIYLRNAQRVYRLCYSFLKNASDAEDATQSVFEKLMKAPKEFKDHEHEKAWLIRTAQNHCRDVLKSSYRKKVAVSDDTRILEQGDGEADRNEVLNAILELPETYKTCVYLFYYEGYTSSEISHMLGVPASTVRNHLAEARTLLGTMLRNEDEGHEG